MGAVEEGIDSLVAVQIDDGENVTGGDDSRPGTAFADDLVEDHLAGNECDLIG